MCPCDAGLYGHRFQSLPYGTRAGLQGPTAVEWSHVPALKVPMPQAPAPWSLQDIGAKLGLFSRNWFSCSPFSLDPFNFGIFGRGQLKPVEDHPKVVLHGRMFYFS